MQYDLRFAVLSDDVKAISKAPGIGAKTAQRMIIELKEKLKLEEAFEIRLSHEEVDDLLAGDARNDTVQALVALGYGRSEAARAVNMVDGADSMDSEQLIKAALKKLAMI